jgi:predicted NAD-dependent protein-ADP-ribosyltransferase YbiA (DUF1768 family)
LSKIIARSAEDLKDEPVAEEMLHDRAPAHALPLGRNCACEEHQRRPDEAPAA